MLKGLKTYIGATAAALTAIVAAITGEIGIAEAVLTVCGAFGLGGLRAKLGRDRPDTDR